jgi:hypothetical protein
MEMQVYLKVKVKSLAAEAAIIRLEERKVKARRAWARAQQKDETELTLRFNGLREHRKRAVRVEARISQLAYGFLRRTPYSRVEHADSQPFDKKRVCGLLTRYGDVPAKEAEERLEQWLKG